MFFLRNWEHEHCLDFLTYWKSYLSCNLLCRRQARMGCKTRLEEPVKNPLQSLVANHNPASATRKIQDKKNTYSIVRYCWPPELLPFFKKSFQIPRERMCKKIWVYWKDIIFNKKIEYGDRLKKKEKRTTVSDQTNDILLLYFTYWNKIHSHRVFSRCFHG